MLVIGSRALRRSFPSVRAALDWDVVGTRAELAELTQRLDPLEGVAWSARKAYFCKGDRPLEFIVADDSPWEQVLGLSGVAAREADLGDVVYASPATLLLLKLAHLHLVRHWWKTAEDVDFLAAHTRLGAEHEALLEPLRRHAESRRGSELCAFAEPRRLRDDAPSPSVGRRRAAMHEALGNVLARFACPSRTCFAASLPMQPTAAAALLAEIAMVHAATHHLYPILGARAASAPEERRAIDEAIETLCTVIFGRDVRIALAPHAVAARKAIPRGFYKKLARIMDRDVVVETGAAFAPDASRPDLAIVHRLL